MNTITAAQLGSLVIKVDDVWEWVSRTIVTEKDGKGYYTRYGITFESGKYIDVPADTVFLRG